jgi:phage repressor protein C with HTH and peptisase S24 domain
VRIADFLGVPAGEVLRHAGGIEGVALEAHPPRRGRPPLPSREQRPDTIPIRGPSGAVNRPEDSAVGATLRPANLAGVRDAYAIYVSGDEMEPRYAQGWLLHINPHKPPIRGRDVVLHTKSHAVLIKQFVSWDGDAIVVRQLNPEEILRIPHAEVLECHLVVGVDQEG